MEKLKVSNSYQVKSSLESNFNQALKSTDFQALLNKINVSPDEAKKNTSKLEDTLNELHNCKNCKGLFNCHNEVSGHIFFPEKREGHLIFSYTPCKYQKKADQAIENKKTGLKEINNARMKDIDLSDKKRIKIIKWLKDFYDAYTPYTEAKGLYLHGSFGSGKTFLIVSLFNELANKKNANTEIIYFPELLRTLKEDFSVVTDKINYLENVDLLLIDDIGAENVTTWGRDEILGTILQSRMNDKLPTFFTSNLTIEELESHLSITKKDEDVVKARRIVERIKQLTNDLELVSINRRK